MVLNSHQWLCCHNNVCRKATTQFSYWLFSVFTNQVLYLYSIYFWVLRITSETCLHNFFLYFWRHESLLYSIQLPTTLALLISKYLFSLIWEWHIIITTHYKIYFKINYIYSIFLNFNYSLLCPINKILFNLKY